MNHYPVALECHRRAHPHTEHVSGDIQEIDPKTACRGRKVEMGWFSPSCTHFSGARGGKPCSEQLRSLAWVTLRWARDVRPRVIYVENVREFEGWGPLRKDCTCAARQGDVPLDDCKHAKTCPYGTVIPDRKGETFDTWVGLHRELGYQVEWRLLKSCDYGSATSRKRLYVIMRCDGLPIVWPAPTHGPGLKPYRAAWECIDWSLPTTSIFGRKKPLADKTMWRIAQGIRRYVLEAPDPFLIKVNHGGMEARVEGIWKPLSTVTAARRGHALIVPSLVQTGYGERKGQRARALDIQEPLGTVMATGAKHAEVVAFLERHACFLNRHFGGKGANKGQGEELTKPVPTVTTRDHHSVTAVNLVHFRGTGGQHPALHPCEPMPTTSAGGNHVGEVRAFLSAYYGSDGTGGQGLEEPMRTATTKARLGLVMIEGTEYQITDIGFRMLRPHELLRANAIEYFDRFDLSAAETLEDQQLLIGNMVNPEVSYALASANMATPTQAREAA